MLGPLGYLIQNKELFALAHTANIAISLASLQQELLEPLYRKNIGASIKASPAIALLP